MPAYFEVRRQAAADALTQTVNELEQYLARPDADTSAAEYVALREKRDEQQDTLADVIATLDARRLAQHVPTRPDSSGQMSSMRRVLREYDRGNSERFNIEYDLRELQTGDPYFTPNPTRISVANLPTLTPSLDLVRTVQTSNFYDFVVPPPPEAALTVPEGAKKPTRDWVSTKVSGTLETDAHLLDVTKQTLEDDASAERTLRAWLVEGVRLHQDAKVQAAISGATGTGTATGATVAEGLRNGKAELSELGLPATAAYLNPADAAELDLGAYTANGDLSGFTTAWGMRIVESTAIVAGSPMVGSMSTAVYFLYRNSISTYITDTGTTDEATPRDRFSHNLLGILAEGRSKAVVVFPQALVKVTITPTP